MTFTETEAEFRQLKAQYDAGDLSETDFKARLQDLMIQDEQGRWWMIGYETGQWYVHDGEKWVRSEPPIPQENLAAELAAPEAPPMQKPDAVSARPKAKPSIPWLRVGVGIVVAAVIIGVLAQLAGRGQPAPTPIPIAPPTESLASARPAEPAAAAPTPPTSREDIKVAILAPLTGHAPTFGTMTRDGALLAIEEWNARGGVLGRKIAPIVEDSQCEADPAIRAANKVINEGKVKFIIGEVCSRASIPISEITNNRGILQISPTSTNPSVTVTKDGKTKEYVFRACFIDPFQGTVGAKFVLNYLRVKTAFIMSDQSNVYGKGLAEYFEKTFVDGGGQIVGRGNYDAADTDFSAILSRVAAAKPDVIYLPDYYNIVNLVTRQAKEKGITTAFLGGDGWASSDLDLKAAAGGFFTSHYAPDSTAPAAVEFQIRVFQEV